MVELGKRGRDGFIKKERNALINLINILEQDSNFVQIKPTWLRSIM